MRMVWVFFKLRMRQLRYDKVALVFCYVFPVVLLLGIGYPLALSGNQKIKVSYLETEIAPAGKPLIEALDNHELVHAIPFVGERVQAEAALRNNEIQHLLSVSGSSAGGPANVTIGSNSLEENRISAIGCNHDGNNLIEKKAPPSRSMGNWMKLMMPLNAITERLNRNTISPMPR